ncbi:hypothetical protein Bca4012_001091 [Brassica carinata]
MTPPRPPSGRQRPLQAHRKYGGIGTLLVIKVAIEQSAKPIWRTWRSSTNESLHYTEKPETFSLTVLIIVVYVFTPDIFTAIRLRDVSSQRKDTAILRRVSSFEALQSATRFVCLSLVCVSLHA